ncbi:putative zinc-binding alcohol dehydrogenase [Aaosphaeria arxii CBS 175.79]|uniref:alcohol dehydrogenase (NADP(+)) n=1 Tax=Aaosphaeria arxii CBS 175.79 TaxID=1450172 RepID=A0A6A5XBM4_9PLEO|nr:putative zinc-binding alcohol dehydrogenase [Aaosphaeria arxii CBS 175.79]KAF2010475.1 putative zinc-binding alcohol dehydrogenase [Aaosphaeria arxii CBS 175.79]
MADYKFEGWMGIDENADKGNMVWQEFQPKAWEETDIDIKITHSGICGSDLHTLRSGWGPTPYPCCVGHEIVGIAVRVGSKVTKDIKVGDRVGVGAQSDSCLGRKGSCENCAAKLENYCPHFVGTYGMHHFNGDKSYGGHALYNRSPSHFVFKIPDAVPSAYAAPMLCAGITTYSPLKHYGAGPGKTVGIIGLGGLGHFGVLWAKALGADRVVAISRKADKRATALDLGADEYISTDADADWAQKHAGTIDIIISTISSSKMPIGDYLSLLKLDGTLVQVGNPDDGVFQVPALPLILRRVTMGGSAIGSPAEIVEMLQLAADKKVTPLVEERPMKDANQAMVDMDNGKARYRYVLVNEQHL